MVYPIQRNQNTSTSFNPGQTQSTPQRIPRRPARPDTIQAAQTQAQGANIFRRTWDAIAHCFKSIFSCFFNSGSRVARADPKTKIQEIAARDHFLWFYNQEQNPLTAFMGNFHPCTVRLWGLQFQCSEAAFQAEKFSHDLSIMRRFQNLDGDAAWRLGRQLSQGWSNAEKVAWRNRSVDVMRTVVHAKFQQNPQLEELLLATGHAYLVEHTGRDAFWGDNGDGRGQNRLGSIVMETRGQLGGIGYTRRNGQYDRFAARPRQ